MSISKIKNKIASLNLNIFGGIFFLVKNPLFITKSILSKSFSPKKFISLLLISVFLFLSFSFLNLKTSYGQDNSNDVPVSGVVDAAASGPVPKAPLKTFCSGYTDVGCNIGYWIMKITLEVVGIFTRLAANTFDWAVNGYILNIKTLFLEEGISGQDKAWLYKSWSVVRDIANILMFFSAMYIGVKYILGSEELDFRKSLIKIIIFAVFVNFSFPIAKFAIDTSNFVSLSIRGGITGFDSVGGISKTIIDKTGISLLVTDIGNAEQKTFKGYSNASSMALAIVFLLVSFFVFLYAAIMILLRAIVLLVCVIFSPLMFLTSSFKSLENINKMWRDNFIGQILFGPVLMIGLWVSINFLGSLEIGAVNDIANSVNGITATSDVSATGTMILAVLSLFLTVFAANKVSTGLGGAIGGFVGSGMKNIGLGVATGGAGLAIRGGVGRIGAMAANSKWLKDKAQNGNFISRRVASGMSLAGDKMANAKVTIGGRTTTSTADKNNQAKEKMNKDQSDFIENNKGAINANPALRDELYKARGDKNKFAIVSAKLDPKNAGKTDGQLSRELGIVSDADIEKAKARKLENKDNLQANRVSSSNADAYLDAKEKAEIKQKNTAQNILDKSSDENNTDLRKDRLARLEEANEKRVDIATDQYKNTNRIANAAFATGKGVSNAAVFLRGGKKSNSASPAEDSARSNDALTPEQSANLKK